MGLGVAAVVGLNGLEPKRFGEVGRPEAGTGEGRLAEQLMDRVAACAGKIADDAAACLLWADEGRVLLPPHSEQIELTLAELRGPLARARTRGVRPDTNGDSAGRQAPPGRTGTHYRRTTADSHHPDRVKAAE